MIDKGVIQKIEDLAHKSAEIKIVDGLPYSAVDNYLVSPPVPKTLNVLSLNSLLDFSRTALTDNDKSNYMFHVISPTEVDLVAVAANDHAQRTILSKANVTKQIEGNFNFGKQYNLEEFIVGLQGAFKPTENLLALIEAVSKVSTSAEDKIEDDGVTQTVASKKGVHLKERVSLPNPIELVPYKSFPEIEVPAEKFVFRISREYKEVHFRLFNNKSMVWELNCAKAIKEYLSTNGDLKVI